MRVGEKLLLVLAAGIGLNYWLKGKAVKNLVFLPGQIQDFAMDGATPIVRAAVIVQNTNSVGFTIQSLAGNVFSEEAGNAYLVGNVSSFVPVHIAANSQTLFILNFRLFPSGIVNAILQAIQLKTFIKNLQIDGLVNVDGAQFALNLNFKAGA